MFYEYNLHGGLISEYNDKDQKWIISCGDIVHSSNLPRFGHLEEIKKEYIKVINDWLDK